MNYPRFDLTDYYAVYGFAGNVATFIIATGFIGKYAGDPTKGFATVATVFLFFYILL